MGNDGEKEKVDRSDSNDTAATQRNVFPSPPHTLASEKLVQLLNTDPLKGLDESEVAKLQEQYGPNRIKPPRKPSFLKITGRQIVNGASRVRLFYRYREVTLAQL